MSGAVVANERWGADQNFDAVAPEHLWHAAYTLSPQRDHGTQVRPKRWDGDYGTQVSLSHSSIQY